MRISIISTLFFLSFSFSCIAQSNNNSKNTIDNNLYARIGYHMPFFDFTLNDAADKGEPIDYNANVPFALSLSLNYKSFGISVSKDFSSSVENGALGKTKFTDIQFNYLENRYGFELYYQKYKGYNLGDCDKFGYVEGDLNAKRPDINNQNIGLNAFFLFNKKHSLKTLLNHFSKPDKFELSFLLMSSFNSLKLTSSRNMIPATETIYYGNNSDYRGGNYNVLSVAPGVSLAIPGRRFYLSTVLMAGYGMSFSEKHFANEDQTGLENFLKINFKIAYGYCGKKMIAGLAYNMDSLLPIGKEGTDVEFQTFCGTYDVFIGYKF